MTAPQVYLDIDLSPQPSSGFAYYYPTVQVTDPTDGITVTPAAQGVAFNGSLQSLQLYATDNANMGPAGWAWFLDFSQNPVVPGKPSPVTFFAPAGPLSFTATSASPSVFTWTSNAAFMAAFPSNVLPNGTAIVLSGTAPAGFTNGTTYYVVNSAVLSFSLSATRGGPAIASTGTGNGTFTVTRYTYSGLVPQGSSAQYSAFILPGQALPSLGKVVAVASGPLTANTLAEVNATSGALTMTLPSPGVSQVITVEKTDATANAVIISGSIRGSAGTLKLPSQNDSLTFYSYAGTWYVLAGHKPLAGLQALFGTVVPPTGDTTGAGDVAALQAALTAAQTAGAGVVKGQPGATYYLNATLVIGSGTTLDMTGCTVNLVNGSNCSMLVDSAHNAGTLTVPSAMKNITVTGGIWDRNNNQSGTNLGRDMMILGGGNLTVRNIRFQATGAVSGAKYALLVQNSVNFTVEYIRGYQYISDLIHLTGPLSFGTIRNIYAANNKDDTVSFTCIDWVGQNFGNEGDITDVVVDGVFCDGQSIANGVAIYSGKTTGGTVLNTARIKIRNIHGFWFTPAGQPVYIGDSSAAPTAAGVIDDIIIDGIDAAMQSATKSLVQLNSLGASTSIGIGSLKVRNVTVRGDCQSVIENHAPVAYLEVKGVTGATAAAPFGGGGMIYQSGALASISKLSLGDVNVTQAGTQGGSLISSAGSGQSLTEAYLDNVWFTNFGSLASLITTTALSCSNLHAISNGAVINTLTGASVTLTQNPTCVFDTAGNTGTGTVVTLPAATSQRVTVDTSATGLALSTGTQTILTWTAPNDGQVHDVSWSLLLHVSTAGTGGNVVTGVSGKYTSANGFGGSLAVNWYQAGGNAVLQPGDTFTISQSVGLTGSGVATITGRIRAA